MKEKIKKFFIKLGESYSKIAINFILINSILMMWCSYILAWNDKIEIAEALSSTITDVIVGTIVCYLCTKTVENISKYGSRLNRTCKEDELEAPCQEPEVIDLSSGGKKQ